MAISDNERPTLRVTKSELMKKVHEQLSAEIGLEEGEVDIDISGLRDPTKTKTLTKKLGRSL